VVVRQRPVESGKIDLKMEENGRVTYVISLKKVKIVVLEYFC
jgi:hypothetical protein